MFMINVHTDLCNASHNVCKDCLMPLIY